MLNSDHTFTRTMRVLACGLAVCAITASGAVAGPVQEPPTDFRSPDTRDAAEGYAPKLVGAPQRAPQRTDFRSPDTRDAAEGYAPALEAEPSSASGGFDWGTAGVVAAGVAGLFIVALAMVSLGRHGRRRVARS